MLCTLCNPQFNIHVPRESVALLNEENKYDISFALSSILYNSSSHGQFKRDLDAD